MILLAKGSIRRDPLGTKWLHCLDSCLQIQRHLPTESSPRRRLLILRLTEDTGTQPCRITGRQLSPQIPKHPLHWFNSLEPTCSLLTYSLITSSDFKIPQFFQQLWRSHHFIHTFYATDWLANEDCACTTSSYHRAEKGEELKLPEPPWQLPIWKLHSTDKWCMALIDSNALEKLRWILYALTLLYTLGLHFQTPTPFLPQLMQLLPYKGELLLQYQFEDALF